jgi:predicted nuclease of predicted toxin-antitoxin system
MHHARPAGPTTATDQSIRLYAVAADAVIITKDEDFAQRRAASNDGPRIVWVRVGNTTRRDLPDWFQFRLALVLEGLARGESLIEIV